MFKKLFGNRNFYKSVIALTLPIMIQNGITNLVNMLDNVMVGQTGTAEMTGVAIANQLIFVFNLCVFGAVSGAGIFGAQFFGSGNHTGVRHTFRFKIIMCAVLSAAGIAVFLLAGPALINLYLKGEGNRADAAASLGFAERYLHIMLIGLFPWSILQCYAGTLREGGKAIPPMVAGAVAVLVNLVLNYILIFGHFGAPRLGVIGAAVATVISRFVELAIIVIYTFVTRTSNRFIVGAFRSLYVPADLIRKILVKGMPLMANETMWSMGIATLNQCYSRRGLDVVAANNICQTFWNVFSVCFMAVGVSIGIMLGQQLGADDCEKAKATSYKLITFSVLVSLVMGAVMFIAADFVPFIYRTEDSIRHLATSLMCICAVAMPIDAFANATYFTLRSGGKVFTTFLFDSGFVWCVSIPVVLVLTEFTSLPILPIFAVAQFINIVKCVVGFALVRKGSWAQNIVAT